MKYDAARLIDSLVFLFVGGGVGWLFASTLKLRRDVESSFRKLRKLYKNLYKAEWEKHWEE